VNDEHRETTARSRCRGTRSRWFCTAALLVVMSVAGCAVTVNGSARPGANVAPRSLTGPTIKRVLVGHRGLSRILNQSFRIDPRFPPRFGGREALQDDGWDSPGDCLGVAATLQQGVYQSSNVKHVAIETWRHAAGSAAAIGVTEGVVSLPTAADAQALFAKFSQQWRKCDGTTIPLSGTVFRLKATTTNVQVVDSIVAASVSTSFASRSSDSASIPAGRAIGVRGNCLVEVEVTFFGNTYPSGQGAADPHTSAVEIARNMLDKVAALS
jgi:PknH-like extracellular domain